MSTATSKPVFKQQVRIEELRMLYRQLGHTLIRARATPERTVDLLENHLRVRCCQCEITITGKELAEAALHEASSGTNNQKVSRLIVGYCGRNGCHSYYCDLLFDDVPDVDWPVVWKSATQVLETEAGQEAPAECQFSGSMLRSPMTALVHRYGWRRTALATLTTLWIIWLVYWYLRPPAYSRNPSGYKAAPEISIGLP